MRDGFELLLLVEEDIKWLGDAAKRFDELASQLDEPEKSKWGLLAAVYQERVEVHQEVVEKLRDVKKPTEFLSEAKTAMRESDKKRHDAAESVMSGF